MRQDGSIVPLTATAFQFTHPVWDATAARGLHRARQPVSIHASRVGCDAGDWTFEEFQFSFNSRIPCGMRPDALRSTRAGGRFNSRIPCGMRLNSSENTLTTSGFQFTHPVWDATPLSPWRTHGHGVSIHASRVGCDPIVEVGRGESMVSIHASRVGCDRLVLQTSTSSMGFNSRIPCGMRLVWWINFSSRSMFQFTHPVWDATKVHVLRHEIIMVSIHASRVGCDCAD